MRWGPSPLWSVRLRPLCRGHRQRQPRPSRRALPSATAMSAALMGLRVGCGGAAARATHPLRKSIVGARSGALLPTATRRPTCISRVVRIFGKVAHRHEKPSLQAFWRSSGNRPPSVPRPGDHASKTCRDFRGYRSCPSRVRANSLNCDGTVAGKCLESAVKRDASRSLMAGCVRRAFYALCRPSGLSGPRQRSPGSQRSQTVGLQKVVW
jgi:hypothetical protein